MDKERLYIFSIKVRKLIENQNLSGAIDKIKEENLSEDELNFLFMCLHTNGYDSKTDSFMLFESDNSAFLRLVNLVQSKVSTKE